MAQNTFVTKSAIAVLDSLREIIKTRKEFTATEIGAAVGRSQKVVSPYLRYLSVRGEIHCVPGVGSALLWRDGPAPDAVGQSDDEITNDRYLAPRRKMIAAKQLGMARDSMIAALFGPARAVSA